MAENDGRGRVGLNVGLFQEICIWVVILSAVFELLACIAIAPSDKPENFPKKKNKKNVNLLDTWHLLKDNRAMQMYSISGVSDKVASNAASQAAITTLIYGVIIAKYGFSGTVSGYSMIPNILFLLFGTQLMTKSGTKKSLVTWTAIPPPTPSGRPRRALSAPGQRWKSTPKPTSVPLRCRENTPCPR